MPVTVAVWPSGGAADGPAEAAATDVADVALAGADAALLGPVAGGAEGSLQPLATSPAKMTLTSDFVDECTMFSPRFAATRVECTDPPQRCCIVINQCVSLVAHYAFTGEGHK
ncbi:hypothetical protein [Paractinoplanes toevensis]|uniref:hypothetical protein n=1 Tax=Paractinoplanes toevensis TaxID=571911 RepID=UPI001BB3550D|nr:hypothetical protein [Actinoplanes toevensis]